MYIPKDFVSKSRREEINFLKKYSFGTIISSFQGGTYISKAPFLLKEEKEMIVLEGHLARINSHLDIMKKEPKLSILFDGPHDYISPTWYKVPEKSVPIWNYSSVLVQGTVELTSSSDWLLNSVLELTQRFEKDRAWEELVDLNYLKKLSTAIIGLKVKVSSLDGKFKLSQNKTFEDREKIIKKLENINLGLADDMKIWREG